MDWLCFLFLNILAVNFSPFYPPFMFRFFLMAILSLVSSCLVVAQTITLGRMPNSICAETTVILPISTTGTFGASNRFTVQLAKDYYYNSTNITTYPAELVDGSLRFVVKDLPYQDYQLTSSSFYLRVVSTAPVVQSEWSTSFYVRFIPDVTLSAISEVGNPYDPYIVRFKGRGNGPLTATLNDSVRISFGDWYNVGVDQQYTLSPARSGLLRLTAIQNSCGVGKASGTALVKINPVPVRVTSLSGQALCAGSVLRINIDKGGGTFGAGNAFKVRLTPTEAGRPTIELDATEADNTLSVTLPETLDSNPNVIAIIYQVRVLATNPAVTSASAETNVIVYARPSAAITTGSQTINLGQVAEINVRGQGVMPYSVVMNDGQLMTQQYGFSNSMTRVVKPTQTSSYSLTSFSSGCGAGMVDRSVLQVTVRAGVAIDSLVPPILCEGQQAQVRAFSNANFSPNAQYSVRFIGNGSTVYATAPAVLTGTRLTFTVPVISSLSTYGPISYQMQVRVSDQASVSDGPLTTDWVRIQARPKASLLATQSAQPVTAGTQAYLNVAYSGGGPYRVTLHEGSEFTYESSGNDNYGTVRFFPYQSGTYTIREVRNQCFVGTGEGKAQVTVTDAIKTGIVLSPPQLRLLHSGIHCPQDSLLTKFSAFGSFDPANTYTIQVRKDYNLWVPVATNVQPGANRIKLGPGNYQIRVVSSNPLLYSQEQSVRVADQPRLTLGSEGESTTVVAGESRVIRFQPSEGLGPYTVVLSDGINDVVRVVDYNFREPVRLDRTTTYTIKSITDQCGVTTPSTPALVYTVQPLKIVITAGSDGSFFACTGSSVRLPFAVLGSVSNQTSYQLQLAKTSGVFTDIGAPVSQSPFEFVAPADLAAGAYQFRVVVRNPDVISSPVSIDIRTKPTARLTATGAAGEVQIEGGNVARLNVNLTGGGGRLGYRVVFSDEVAMQYYSEEAGSREVSPGKRTTYSLKAVTNGCGYGTVSGQVQVSVKPTLTLRFADDESETRRVCAGTTVVVTYRSRGEFGGANRFQASMQLPDKSVRMLESSVTESGSLTVAIPATYAAGVYQIKVTATDPSLSTVVQLYVSTPPQMSIAGNTIINAGQTAYLPIRLLATLPNQEDIEIALSTGQRLNRYAYINPGEITYAAVMPTQTTTYTITTVRNSCGVGSATGTAQVTVNPASANSISVTRIGLYQGLTNACAGDTLAMTYEVSGTLPAGSSLIAQCSDSTGGNFVDLPTILSGTNTVRGVIAATTASGSGYRVRIRVSDPAVAAGAYAYPVSLRARPTARFSVPTMFYEAGKPVQAVVLLGGEGPWSYRIETDLSAINRLAYKSPDTVSLRTVSPNVAYRISTVSNAWCRVGQVNEPGRLQVELITALEPGGAGISVAPNPTTDRLTINWPTLPADSYSIQLATSAGSMLLTRTSRQSTETVNLATYPSGIYLLTIRQGERTQVVRVIKQ